MSSKIYEPAHVDFDFFACLSVQTILVWSLLAATEELARPIVQNKEATNASVKMATLGFTATKVGSYLPTFLSTYPAICLCYVCMYVCMHVRTYVHI